MSSPYPIFGSQDFNDDDGPVIDSLLIEVDAPPDKSAAVDHNVLVEKLESPKVITRVISKDETIDPTWDAYLVLPADANRKSLNVLVYSPTAVLTDGVRFSDEKGNIRTAGKVLHQQDVSFIEHTGPVYVIACGAGANGAASAPVSLQIWSITE